MLPLKYKFYCINNCGVDVGTGGIDLTITQWKFDSQGALSYEGTPDTRTDSGGITNTQGQLIGAEIDNGTDKYLGAHVEYQVTIGSGTVSGTVDLYMLRSADGTTFDDASTGASPVTKGKLICSITPIASATVTQIVEI